MNPKDTAAIAAAPDEGTHRANGNGFDRGPATRRSPRRPVDAAARPSRTVIEPRSGWRFVDLRELRDYRDLLRFLIWREFRGRYAQSALGIGWAVVQPVASALIFTVVFGRMANIESDGVPYGLFVFSGTVLWGYFSGALTGAASSLSQNAHMISKIYFPRLVLPLAAATAKLVDLAISSLLLAVLLAWLGVMPGRDVVLLPALLAVMILAALGLGMWLSAMAVQYRDVNHGMTFAVQLLMYLSPVVYPVSLVPERFRLIYGLNPMAGVISGARAVLLGTHPFPWDLVLVGSLSAATLAVTGAFYFRRMERLFADVV